MINTQSGNDALASEIERRHVAAAASKHLTAGSLRVGWIILLAGFCLPVLPVVGLFLMIFTGLIGCFIGVLAIFKGNTSGGVKLVLAAWLGSGLVAVAWILFYATVVTTMG